MSDLPTQLQLALAERYNLDRELGRGGMATVYLAEDLKHHRPVAIKVFKPELSQAIGSARFLREIEISARLNHPHILPLYDSGEADGLLYYVMPYAEGESLRDRLNREKQLPLDDALQIAREVADALSYAHSRGVIHRDIKPENILLDAGHAVVADFGIARAITAAGGERLTETGLAIGTPAYMSPEQAAGSTDLDGRSDVYAVGCVLYEMLAGQPPFTGPTVESIVYQHLSVPPPSITSMRPAVPAHVAAALERALAKTPADRFSRIALFAEALGERLSSTAAPSSRPTAASRRLARPLLAAVATLVAIGAAVQFLRPAGGEPEPTYPRTALAVLPFQNLSADPADAYFAGGLHDELLTQLSKVGALSLRGRTSVMGYAGTTKSIREIAEELRVGVLVEGSVQVVGGRLRVNAQLIDAATDEHLWAESYDRTLDDAFAIQSDIAQHVVAAVGAALGAAERELFAQAPTASPEAYRLYLQGLDYVRRPGLRRQDRQIAQQLFERAVAHDPGFALAYAALSEAHGLMHWARYDTSPERVEAQRSAAEAAFRLDPDLPQAREALGLWHFQGRRDWAAALAEFDLALGRMPNDALLLARTGYVQRRLGRWDDVYQACERASELDPRSAEIAYNLCGLTYDFTRRYGDAVRAYDRALALAPDLHVAAVLKGITYVLWQGQLDTLRAALQRIPRGADLAWADNVEVHHATRLLWERKPDSLITRLESVPGQIFEGAMFLAPISLYAAWAHELRGDPTAARLSFDSARVLLDSILVELPDDWRARAALGHALAGLARRDEALREARWLQQSIVYREDAFWGAVVAEARAMILAHAGETEAALDEIERLLAGPSWVSGHTLRLDPRWDPIREHPRFQALLRRYALN